MLIFLNSLIAIIFLIYMETNCRAEIYRVDSPVKRKMINLNLPPKVQRRRQWHPTPVLLPGKSHGLRSLVGCSPWGCKESDMTEQLHFHTLEKEMATHSSVLAWRIPGTGEPDGLPSMRSHKVGRDWNDLAAATAAAAKVHTQHGDMQHRFSY